MSFPLELLNTIVENGYNAFQAYANNSYTLATTTMQTLSNFEPAYEPSTLNFTPELDGVSFVAPARPTRTIHAFQAPDDPADFNFQTPEFDQVLAGAVPTDPNPTPYTYREPGGAPGALTATPPDAPTVSDVDFPDRPALSLPTVPTFYSLSLPTPPALEELSFSEAAPEIDFQAPAQMFAFTEQDYVSALLDKVKAKIDAGLDGGTGLPAAIEQALFDRARNQEEANAARAVQEVSEEFANRGFSEPNGVLAQRLLQVRQNNQNQQNQLRRQVEIENKQIEIEQLRFFVSQGIALEQSLLQAHLTQEERRFQAARYLFDVMVQVFNSRVALFNASVAAYQAKAQVFRDRIQAQLARVERYKAEIDGQRAISDINKTLAERYDIEMRGVQTLVEVYRAEVQAATARVEAGRSKIESYRAGVQAYGERVRAYQAEWEGYATRVRAALGNVEAFDVATRSYATKVSAWNTKWGAAVSKFEAQTRLELAKAQKYDSDIRKYLALVETERAQITADVEALRADASVYAAASEVARSESAAKDRSLQVRIEQNRSQAELHLKNSEINIRSLIEASAQRLEALRAVSQNATQLTASALSTMSVGGSVSGSTGFSYGQDFNYSGDIQDPANPNF